MDMSRMRSAKSGTDFSIERILSSESGNREGAPSWLCCTRYQPPRLPHSSLTNNEIQQKDIPTDQQVSPHWPPKTRSIKGAVNSNVCRSRRSGRHARVPFTAAQAAALEAAYARAPYLAPPALRALAAALQLRDDRIKIWFQNRRARERREKCTTIAPPHAVTLPPTQAPVSPWTSVNHLALSEDNCMAIAHNSLEVEGTRETICEDSRGLEERSDSPLDVETVDE